MCLTGMYEEGGIWNHFVPISGTSTTWTDFTGVGEKSRMETAMDEDAFSLSKGSFTVSDLQSVIMGFYLMGNVGVLNWNEFRRSVGGRLRDSPQMRGVTRSPHLGIRDKWVPCAFYRSEVVQTQLHGLAEDQTNKNDHSPQKQLVSPEFSKRRNINNSRN